MPSSAQPTPPDRLPVVPVALFAALVATSWAYRADLLAQLVDFAAAPESGTPEPVFRLALHHAWVDVAVAATLALAALLLGTLALRALPGPRWLLRTTGAVLCVPFLLAFGMVHQTHVRLLFSLQTGLTSSLLWETLQSGEVMGVLQNAGPADFGPVLAPTVLFLICLWLLRKVPGAVVGFACVMAAGVVAVSLLVPAPGAHGLPVETGESPVWFLFSDWIERGGDLGASDELAGLPGTEQLAPAGESGTDGPTPPASPETSGAVASGQPSGAAPEPQVLRLTDPRLARPGPVARDLPPKSSKPWNIVWVVLESTGTRYFEGKALKNAPPPMPYLKGLADQGWYLSHHRSPSNSSATSIFAQFSGLYPSPTLRMFSTSKDNYVPTLFGFLGTSYDSFLVTPGKLTYFFPRDFLAHGGLRELWGFDEVPVTRNPGGEGLSKDETEVVGFFLQRLHKAKPPFAAVYYTYAPHWKYTNYGPKYDRYKDPRMIGDYHDNLWMIDQQIQRMVEQLRADGLLDSTILVFVGDHGEAFGQHERNWAHARGSFEENFQTPAILWQPKLFPPKVETRETSHVDLLPTLLDALHLPYDDQLLQGESLFQRVFRRTVQFHWGNEGMITARTEAGVKVQVSITEKRCQVFDLGKDPEEKRKLGCQNQGPWVQVIRDYVQFQKAVLPAYSEATRQGRPFQGKRHAVVAPVVP